MGCEEGRKGGNIWEQHSDRPTLDLHSTQCLQSPKLPLSNKLLLDSGAETFSVALGWGSILRSLCLCCRLRLPQRRMIFVISFDVETG